MAVKTVGASGSGIVHLTPRVHRYIRTLASQIAQREYGPQIAVDRAALQNVRSLRHTDVRSVRGATNLAETQLKAAGKSLKTSGLKGQYRSDVAGEIASRRADVATSEPGLAATVRGTYASDIASAKNTILGDKAQVASETARNFYSLLDKAKTQARSTIHAKASARRTLRKAEATSSKDRGQNQRQANAAIHRAMHVAMNLLISPPKGVSSRIPLTPKQWVGFERVLAGTSNIGTPTQRARAAKIVTRRFQNNPRLIRQALRAAGLSDQEIRRLLTGEQLQGAIGRGGPVGIG